MCRRGESTTVWLYRQQSALVRTHEELLQRHEEAVEDGVSAHRQLLGLTQEHADLMAAHQIQVPELERVEEVHRERLEGLTSDLERVDQRFTKLTTAVKDIDFRSKNAPALLQTAAQTNKELIEENVKKDKEVNVYKQKAKEQWMELQRVKTELEHQTELTKKREEQVQLLLTQLQRREQEQEQVKRSLQKRDEEGKRLRTELQTVQSKLQPAFSSAALRDIEEARGHVEANDGEMRAAKEAIKSFHTQLRRKEGEVLHLKKKAEEKRAVKLPPLKSANNTNDRKSASKARKSLASDVPASSSSQIVE